MRESARLCGITEIALTKLDVLSGLDEIQICTAYMFRGEQVLYPPQVENGMDLVTPVYETMPGWRENIERAKTWEELPKAARDYVLRLEELTGIHISIISVGPDREQTLFR